MRGCFAPPTPPFENHWAQSLGVARTNSADILKPVLALL